MVVTEEIIKCWMCSDRPITHCLITGTLPKDTANTPYVSDALSESVSPTPIFGIVELIDLREYEHHEDFKDELGNE